MRYRKRKKGEEGITLIALVITIIILLILAGVAIVMLSGENGILKKAAEAKTETESAQIAEEATLTDMELTTFFLTNNMKYKCRNGYITGFTLNSSEVNESVKDFEDDMETLGYKVNYKYSYTISKDLGEDIAIDESEKATMKIATGMSVQKDGKTIARTIVFGDTNCNGKVDASDTSFFNLYLSGHKEMKNLGPIKYAMDINCNNKINGRDLGLLNNFTLRGNEKIDQNRYVSDIKNMTIDEESYLRFKYTWDIEENNMYEIEYEEKTDTYNFRMKSSEAVKVEDLMNAIPENGKIKRNEEDVATTDNVQNGDKVIYVYNEKEVYVGDIILN